MRHRTPAHGDGQHGSAALHHCGHHGDASRRHQWTTTAYRLYNVSLWLFVLLMLLLQPLGLLWKSLKDEQHILFGRPPQDGTFTVKGSANDEPFTDRAIVCSLIGRLYKPTQLSSLLAAVPATDVTSANASVNGYRVLPRHVLTISAQARDRYANTCDQIATTLDEVVAACGSLGYNVSGVEFLRVVTGENAVALPTTLPVLVLPFWDNSPYARFVVPSQDGRACVFRLSGKYDDASHSFSHFGGVDRSVREAKTSEWLGRSGGAWRHGWYEDASSRWYVDVVSSQRGNAYGLPYRQFDTASGTESDCNHTDACLPAPIKVYWSKDFYATEAPHWVTSITVMDANRDGLFLYEARVAQHVGSVYRLEMLIANLSMAMLLFRWLVALVATHRVGETIGVGALACVRSFHVLPVMLLPRLKTLLAVACSVGCFFEGDQKSLSEAWFVMYPGIVEFSLLVFSLLNLVAKILRRRVSDVLFGPTVVSLCLLHRLRFAIVNSGWFEMSGRVTARVSSSEFEGMRLAEFVDADVVYRMSGAFGSLVALKVALVVLNVVPFVLFSSNTSPRSRVRAGVVLRAAEKALALRVACSGGLGRSAVYQQAAASTAKKPPVPANALHLSQALEGVVPVVAPVPSSKQVGHSSPHARQAVAASAVLPYEVARAGYVVLGRDALVSVKDWFWFMVSAPLRRLGVPMRHLRMVTFTLTEDGANGDAWRVSERPTMCRVTDERFQGVGAWEISLRPLR